MHKPNIIFVTFRTFIWLSFFLKKVYQVSGLVPMSLNFLNIEIQNRLRTKFILYQIFSVFWLSEIASLKLDVKFTVLWLCTVYCVAEKAKVNFLKKSTL